MYRLFSNLSAFLGLLCCFAQTSFAQDHNIQLRSRMKFDGQILANICGYTQNGREYALVGANQGLIIVDITNPDSPVKIVQIPGPVNDWKEIKTYRHYAYVTSEGGQGVQIVDMSKLPSADLPYKHYMGDGTIAGQLNRIHALHIDTLKGFLYTYGSNNLFGGGAVVHDLKDPYNPTFVGGYSELGYVHDGYAENDTLYAGHIYSGTLAIVDMRDKSKPVVLGTTQTPGKFTHNAWLLGDHKRILTTDEAFPSFVTAYDISDPTNITELDRLSTNDGTLSIGHNTHVLNDWAITSWYIDGFNIVDAHRPENLVEVGRYDTYPGGGKFEGCWGVFPFFPSGTIVASNIEPAELFVLTPTYKRACYLEGRITDASNGQFLPGAKIEIAAIGLSDASRFDGTYKTGYRDAGTYQVKISKIGYTPKTVTVDLKNGEVTTLDVALERGKFIGLSGDVMDATTGQPIENAYVLFNGNLDSLVLTDGIGHFNVELPEGSYDIVAYAWGYSTTKLTTGTSGNIEISLKKDIYYDEFQYDYGWLSFGDASSGDWELGEPKGTTTGGQQSNPENDSPKDATIFCYVTGNKGGAVGDDDVDNGHVTLVSPPMHLAGYQDAILSFDYWFFNGGGSGTPNDTFLVKVTNGFEESTVMLQKQSASQWRSSGDISLAKLINLTDDVQVFFTTGDAQPGHLVEGGVDVFKVVPVEFVSTKPVEDANARLWAMPNPSSADFTLRYDWPLAQGLHVEVRNVLGQLVHEQDLGGNTGAAHFGQAWEKGTYIALIRSADKQSKTIKLVKY